MVTELRVFECGAIMQMELESSQRRNPSPRFAHRTRGNLRVSIVPADAFRWCFLLLASRPHTRVHSRPPSLYKQPDEEIAFHLEKRIVGLLRR
jgi:hypothetical protein